MHPERIPQTKNLSSNGGDFVVDHLLSQQPKGPSGRSFRTRKSRPNPISGQFRGSERNKRVYDFSMGRGFGIPRPATISLLRGPSANGCGIELWYKPATHPRSLLV
jgi:hypothetical protein